MVLCGDPPSDRSGTHWRKLALDAEGEATPTIDLKLGLNIGLDDAHQLTTNSTVTIELVLGASCSK